MKLSEIIALGFTETEYFEHQKKLHKERIEKEIRDILRKKDDSAYISRLKKEAEYAMNNMFILPGTGGVHFDVGTPPAWYERRVNDNEYVCLLNRMDYFPLLTELYILTGEKAYGEKALSDIINWIDTCPMHALPKNESTPEEFQKAAQIFRVGVDPWRTLEAGLRMRTTWALFYDRMLCSELMTAEIHTKLALSFYEHMICLYSLTPVFWPKANHNHYLTEMLGLLIASCHFPDMKDAGKYKEFALHELERCASNQFTHEGGQVEGCPGYHAVSLGDFLTAAKASNDFGFSLPAYIRDVCQKAAEYAAYSVLPDGTWSSVGDTPMTVGGDSVARRYYQSFGTLGPMENIFAILPKNDTYIIPSDVQKCAQEKATALGKGDNYQKELGQYIARTGWKREDSYFHFVCATPVNNGHTHQDPMSFVLYLKGEPVVIDPSFFTYQDLPERRLFKSSEYHSCLTFDKRAPFDYVDSWTYTPQKEGHIRNAYKGENFFAADASHHNYDPNLHKRLCALVGDDIFIVVDDVLNTTESDVNIYFHLDDKNAKICGNEALSDNFRVILPCNTESEMLDGRKSPRNDVSLTTSRICVSDKGHKSRLYLTVFTKDKGLSNATVEHREDGVYISYMSKDGRHIFRWNFSESFTEIQN